MYLDKCIPVVKTVVMARAQARSAKPRWWQGKKPFVHYDAIQQIHYACGVYYSLKSFEYKSFPKKQLSNHRKKYGESFLLMIFFLVGRLYLHRNNKIDKGEEKKSFLNIQLYCISYTQRCKNFHEVLFEYVSIYICDLMNILLKSTIF